MSHEHMPETDTAPTCATASTATSPEAPVVRNPAAVGFLGLPFQTAVSLLLAMLLIVPTMLAGDLFFKALEAEHERIQQAFFDRLERALATKKSRQIELATLHTTRFIEWVQQIGSDATDPTQFASAAAHLFADALTRGVYLVAADGSILLASGTSGRESFVAQVRNARSGFIQSNDGVGTRITTATSAPFLCWAADIASMQMRFMQQWYQELASDPSTQMFVVSRRKNAGRWRILRANAGRDEAEITGIELPDGFLPNEPRCRHLLLTSGTQPIGAIADAIVPTTALFLTADASEIGAAWQRFQIITSVKLLAAVLIVLLGGWWFAHTLSRPVTDLVRLCRDVETGTFNLDPPRSMFFELNHLGVTLTRMANRLGTHIEAVSQDLRDQHRRLSALFESVADAVYLVDSSGRMTLANPVARRRFRLPASFPADGLPLPEPRPTLFSGMQETDEAFTVQHHEPLDNAWVQIVVTRLRDQNGQAFGLVVVERDITLEREIDRMKSEFVSNVSHELRTPLTSIQAYTEMLVDGDVEGADQQKEYLHIVLSETERLTRLVNDVLDLARIESGRQVVRKVALDPAASARKTARTIEPWIGRKKQQFVVDLPDIGTALQADRDMLEQALLNLLSNAVKYTPERGTITFSCRRVGDEIVFTVADTGIGLSDRDRERLFTKFFRADHEAVRQAGGTGLGLVLVGEIARLHGGRVEVRSQLGAGSQFALHLPVQRTGDN